MGKYTQFLIVLLKETFVTNIGAFWNFWMAGLRLWWTIWVAICTGFDTVDIQWKSTSLYSKRSSVNLLVHPKKSEEHTPHACPYDAKFCFVRTRQPNNRCVLDLGATESVALNNRNSVHSPRCSPRDSSKRCTFDRALSKLSAQLIASRLYPNSSQALRLVFQTPSKVFIWSFNCLAVLVFSIHNAQFVCP